ncbi:MAG: hypothetical protein NW207_12205 [Cytophagales bacterium]|nr:hypothetical protein [Cytophagales bacterium]
MSVNHHFDLSAAFNDKTLLTSLMWNHHIGIGKKAKFKITYGVRVSNFYSKDVIYTSAPSKYWLKGNLSDTLSISAPQVNNLTLLIGFRYSIGRFDIGFNIDGIGVSYGGQKEAEFTKNNTKTKQDTEVSQLTALLIGANDRGMLKSELYVAYHIFEDIYVRIGISDIFTEYKTPLGISDTNGNDRFRAETKLFVAGISYCPKHIFK